MSDSDDGSTSEDNDWTVSCSLPEIFDLGTGLYIPIDRNYIEEEDPDSILPVIGSESNLDETKTKDCEVQLLEEESTTEIKDKCEPFQSTKVVKEAFWLQELKHTERLEQYDSDDDEEYLPTKVGLDSDLEYDRYESGDISVNKVSIDNFFA